MLALVSGCQIEPAHAIIAGHESDAAVNAMSVPFPTTRDKLKWPFSSDSIWNTPIGSAAIYEPAGFEVAGRFVPGEDYFVSILASDPVRTLYEPGSFGSGRCSGTSSLGTLQVPDSLVVADATISAQPGNPAAFLQPDGRTMAQLSTLARCSLGGSVFGYRAPDVDIYGPGTEGGEGGSGLSSIGGAIRRGELPSTAPIRHALKLAVWGKTSLYFDHVSKDRSLCSRWPAIRCDGQADDPDHGYFGKNPQLVQGTLLALRPELTETQLGLKTLSGKQIFHALQDYGGYIVGNSDQDGAILSVEQGVAEQFESSSGYPLFASPSGGSHEWYGDLNAIWTQIAIVTNNDAGHVGGGGASRVPLAPPIGN